MATQKQTNVLSEELAVKEFHDILVKFVKKPCEQSEVKENYPECISALCSGNLTFVDNVPTYRLKEPILNASNVVEYDNLTIKTRVKPTTKADLSDGLDLQKQQSKFALRLMAHMAGLPSVQMLDKLGRDDYDFLNEICSVFI